MLIKKTLKEKKGIILSDAIIAILIILLFAGLITSLMAKIFLESAKIKSSSQQMDFSTEIFEYVEKIPYASVTQENLINYINNKNADYVSAGDTIESLNTPYKIAITVETYVPEENANRLDIIKIITVKIENNLGSKPYSTTTSRIKKATMQEIEEMLNTWKNVSCLKYNKICFQTK